MPVATGYRGVSPADDLHVFAGRLGIEEAFVGLMTAGWTHEAVTTSEAEDGVTVTVVVTVGLGGVECAGLSPPAAWRPSSINSIVLIDGRLGAAAPGGWLVARAVRRAVAEGVARA